MITNLLFAVIFGVGIFLIVYSFSYSVSKNAFSRIDRARGLDRQEDQSAEEQRDVSTKAILGAFRRKGLGAVLEQAELDISELAFIRFSVGILALGYLAAYVLTGGWGVSIALAIVCEFVFLNWLVNRRETKRREYDESLALMCDHLSSGSTIENSIPGAIDFALELAPDNVKADFDEARKNLTNMGIAKAFASIRARRNSRVLNIIVDGMDVWGGQQGSTEPLSSILEPIRDTVNELTGERKRLEAELSGAMQQAGILALAPIAFVFYMRSTIPGLPEYYATSEGQMLQLASYTIAAAGYYMAQRIVEGIRKIWGD